MGWLQKLFNGHKKELHCCYCNRKIDPYEERVKLKDGHVFYMQKDNNTLKTVFVGKRLVKCRGGLYYANCPPGRLCMNCWGKVRPADEVEAKRKEAVEKDRKQRQREADTVRSPAWVLDNMPMAGQQTLSYHREALERGKSFYELPKNLQDGLGMRWTSEPPVKNLKREQVLRLLRGYKVNYKSGGETVTFVDRGIDYESACEIIHTSIDSWAIVGRGLKII